MISRWSDTPAKIIVMDVATFLFCAFVAWWVDRDEGLIRSTVITWVVLAGFCVGAIFLHIHRLNKMLDQQPVRRPDPLQP